MSTRAVMCTLKHSCWMDFTLPILVTAACRDTNAHEPFAHGYHPTPTMPTLHCTTVLAALPPFPHPFTDPSVCELCSDM